MSLLPQRKKSAEEIAKLRHGLGVPGVQAQPETTPHVEEKPHAAEPSQAISEEVDTILPSNHAAALLHPVETTPTVLTPTDLTFGPKENHSFKRSERLPTAPSPVSEDAKLVTLPVPGLKPVRTLRKSEQLPVPRPPESPPDSNLPHQRHSDAEIANIRRREILAVMNSKPNPKLFPAHPALIIPGYITSISAALGIYYFDFPLVACAVLVSISFLLAIFIALRKPISKHHSAFIVVIALFVIIFAVLHYFPQLRHAT